MVCDLFEEIKQSTRKTRKRIRKKGTVTSVATSLLLWFPVSSSRGSAVVILFGVVEICTYTYLFYLYPLHSKQFNALLQGEYVFHAVQSNSHRIISYYYRYHRYFSQLIAVIRKVKRSYSIYITHYNVSSLSL